MLRGGKFKKMKIKFFPYGDIVRFDSWGSEYPNCSSLCIATREGSYAGYIATPVEGGVVLTSGGSGDIKFTPKYKDEKDYHLKTVVIFGAPDIEEQRARKVASLHGLVCATATVGGEKVNPMTAYRADGYIIDSGEVSEDVEFILFECAPTAATGLKVIAQCDHHNPGNNGFGLPPSQYFKASSLGQLLNFLGIEATQEDRVIAAADHCLSAAYAGLCPGVTAEEVLAMRLPEIMKREGVSSTEGAMTGIKETLELLKNPSKTVILGETQVADIRELGSVPFTIEAGVMTGTPYLAKGDKRFPDKINLSGSKEVVADFLGDAVMVDGKPTYPNGWAAKNGLHQAYGDANRGFAGAYDKPQS